VKQILIDRRESLANNVILYWCPTCLMLNIPEESRKSAFVHFVHLIWGVLKRPKYALCIRKFLFILKHHEMIQIWFWPDFVRSHYAKGNNVNFVLIKDPENVTQSLGIESFWTECKRKYSCRSQKPNKLQRFKLLVQWNGK